MFLNLKHQKLQVYNASLNFLIECYQFSNHLPTEEKFGMISQIRRAALSVHLNMAEGCSRTSAAERKRFFEISRGSVIEIDAAFDVAFSIGYLINYPTENLCKATIQIFSILSGLIRVTRIKNKIVSILHHKLI